MPVFNIRLRELRNKANLSQQELADIIGTSKSSINMYERGEREPGLDTVGKLAEYFDVTTDYILGKTTENKEKKKMAKREWLTDEQVEEEIERLRASEAVSLARFEMRLRYKRRQVLYNLRDFEKKGKALMEAGITREMLETMYEEEE